MNVERSLRRTIWSEPGRHPDMSQWKRAVPSPERGCVYTEVETDTRTSHSWIEVIEVSKVGVIKVSNGIWKYKKRFEGKINNTMPMKFMTVHSILFKGHTVLLRQSITSSFWEINIKAVNFSKIKITILYIIFHKLYIRYRQQIYNKLINKAIFIFTILSFRRIKLHTDSLPTQPATKHFI